MMISSTNRNVYRPALSQFRKPVLRSFLFGSPPASTQPQGSRPSSVQQLSNQQEILQQENIQDQVISSIETVEPLLPTKLPRPSAKRKRERSLDKNPEEAKRERKSGGARAYCHDLGHHFSGYVFLAKRPEAESVARKIYELPVSPQVTRRLIMYVDASTRFLCGAVGVVWRKPGWLPNRPLKKTDFDGSGAFFPSNSDDTETLELFAIATALRSALKDIEKIQAVVILPRNDPSDHHFFYPSLGRTASDTHNLKKELFIFSDHFRALLCLRGKGDYPLNGYVAEQIADICGLSQALTERGVHIELHFSPGHCGIPGNEAAHDMSRKYQKDLAAQTTRSWPTSVVVS